MSRERTVWDKHGIVAKYQDDELIWLREGQISNKMSDLPTPMLMRDIEPYKNMIDGKMITSRSGHRALLKQHGCVEVGNDTSHLTPRQPQKSDTRKKTLASLLSDKSDRQIQKMVKAEIKNRRTH